MVSDNYGDIGFTKDSMARHPGAEYKVTTRERQMIEQHQVAWNSWSWFNNRVEVPLRLFAGRASRQSIRILKSALQSSRTKSTKSNQCWPVGKQTRECYHYIKGLALAYPLFKNGHTATC